VPLSEYLPSYRYANKMTLRQVLTMTGGLSIDTDGCEAPVQGRTDVAGLIENLNHMELEAEPGMHFAYSNCGYDLAGAVVAKLSGMSFEGFLQEHILKPLGMTSTYQLGMRSDSDFAAGYARDGTGWRPAPVSIADNTFASGNLASNAGDLQRWNRALLNASLLPRKTLDEILSVPPLASGAKTIYASGWFVEPGGVIWHGGTLEGYGTVNVLVPATGHAIVLLGNTAPGPRWEAWEVARELYNATGLGPALPEFLPIVGTTLPAK
jgi:CubicO group peptidase (beta-lactamase class C family)